MTSHTVSRDADVPGRERHTESAPERNAGAAFPIRLVRGRAEDPVWVRPALLGLLALTALLFLWDLGASGWANSFYSASVQAGTKSWEAFFFGSSDAGNSITVDKTPLALWPMMLSARVFGLSAWSILVPQALEGVACVGLLYAGVRRTTGSAGAGLLSGLVLALTPVAALMFRFNNPDAMLVLLLTGAAYATLRAVESTQLEQVRSHALRWIVLAGALVGFAFLAKMLQAFLVLPALVLVYALFARTSWPKRLGHLLAAFASMLLAGGWWVAVVSLWPASSRPYIGGSQGNSVLELALGYNGLGRLTGNETGSVVPGGGTGTGGGMWGSTGILRLFDSENGGQIAWLLPAALVLGLVGLWLAGRAGRMVRASLTLWLGWLVVTFATFSFMAGIFHAYYTVALAPAVAALVGTGAWVAWRERHGVVGSVTLAFVTAMTATLSFVLLGDASGYVPWLRWVVLVVGLLAAAGLAVVALLPRRVAAGVAVAATVAALAGPAAYTLSTVTTPHTGSIVTAGPNTGQGPGGFGGGAPGGTTGRLGAPPTGTARGGFGTPPQGGTGRFPRGGTTGGPGGTTGGQNMGALLDGSTVSSAMTRLLQGAASYRWAAAAIGSQTAASYQLASNTSVMPIGGFNGSDPSPTLAQFKAYVAKGEVHYFISGGGFGGGRGSAASGTAISTWVAAHFTKATVGGVTVYDLTRPTSASAS